MSSSHKVYYGIYLPQFVTVFNLAKSMPWAAKLQYRQASDAAASDAFCIFTSSLQQGDRLSVETDAAWSYVLRLQNCLSQAASRCPINQSDGQ
jgi:hypothetical protein